MKRAILSTSMLSIIGLGAISCADQSGVVTHLKVSGAPKTLNDSRAAVLHIVNTSDVARLLSEPGTGRLLLNNMDLLNVDWTKLTVPPLLNCIVFDHTPLNPDVVAWIAKTGVHELAIYNNSNFQLAIRSPALQQSIRTLALQDMNLTDVDVDFITRFSIVRVLSLADSTMSDEQILRVCKLPSLNQLNIIHTNITVSGMIAIREQHPGLILFADEWKAFEKEKESIEKVGQ